METLYEDDDALIERLPGDGQRIVAVFSGIGSGFGGLQRAEFVGTASDGGKNTVLFLTDRRRSWFTTPGLVARMADMVRLELDRAGLAGCHTIGNSMGGYGAIRMSLEMPVAVALAFSPQVSMDRQVIDESRWEEHRAAIDLRNHLPLWECLVPGTRYYAVFGGDSRPERAHRNLLPDTPGLTCLLLPGGGHNIVRLLKEAGELTPLVQAMLDTDDNGIQAVTARFARYVAGES